MSTAKIIRMMRTVLCGEFVIALMILLAISMVQVKAQNANQNRKAAAPDSDCVKVSLTGDSKRLEKKEPIRLRVRVANHCDHTIEIPEPRFVLDKSVIIGRGRWGDRRDGRIVRTKAPPTDNVLQSIEAGKFLEFDLSTNELLWMDSMQSIIVYQDLFTDHDLKPGSYVLYSNIVVYPISRQHYREKGGNVKLISSNKIEILFEEGSK